VKRDSKQAWHEVGKKPHDLELPFRFPDAKLSIYNWQLIYKLVTTMLAVGNDYGSEHGQRPGRFSYGRHR
jgi:hypothetical protein